MMGKTLLGNMPAMAMLAADDLDASRRFWRDTIGLEEVYSDLESGEVAFKAGSSVFGVYLHEGGSSADHTQLAFQVEDVMAVKRDLQDHGVRFEDYDLPNLKTIDGVADMGDEGKGAWFTDPGGNIIALFTRSESMTKAMLETPMEAVGRY